MPVRDANRVIREQAEADPELQGMGTTIAAVALVNDDGGTRLAITNVGDSRAYLLHEGRLNRLTADHSLVADMVRAGDLSEDDARSHPQRHVLTRVVGVAPEIEPYVAWADPTRGDRLLLCSDGLFNEVGEAEITTVLATVSDPDEAAKVLVQLANDHGGSDNITAVAADIA